MISFLTKVTKACIVLFISDIMLYLFFRPRAMDTVISMQ